MENLVEQFGLNRRQLFKLAALGASAATVSALIGGCSPEAYAVIQNRPIRRSISTMPPNDPVIEQWKQAITAMKDLDPTDKRSYDNQVLIHSVRPRHRSWLFLPWHRAYLHYHEEICRELLGDNSFALPYWDWTAAPDVPLVFRDATSPLYHAGRNPYTPADPIFVGADNINRILGETNFNIFASAPVPLNDFALHPASYQGPLEGGPHNHIHTHVGGDLANAPVAPSDPIFWAHHGRIDEVWMEWNILRINPATGEPNPNTDDPAWVDTEFADFYDRQGNLAKIKASATSVLPLLYYRYDTQVTP